jgi:Uma2 family endonuclease
MSAQPKFVELTYLDYLKLPEDGKRYELIDGEIIAMAGAGRRHQRIVAALSAQLLSKLKGQRREHFIAPFDVRLPRAGQTTDSATNVVQPDLMVYCDPKNHDDRGGLGPPELVIEVLSPGNGRHDHVRKLRLYEAAGVQEYWIVDGANRLLIVHVREGERFVLMDSFNFDVDVPVKSVPGLSLDFIAVAAELDRLDDQI